MTFADLEQDLHAKPAFFVEARDNDPTPEADRQAAFVKKARKDGFHVAAILNGERRGQWALNLARKLGAWWGFPDVVVFGPKRFIAIIEFKDGTDMPKQHQIDCMNLLLSLGFPVALFRTADAAMAWVIDEEGCPR